MRNGQEHYESIVSFKKKKPKNACDNCDGNGFAVVDHVAWLSGGDVKEKDIYDCCPVCDGTGQMQEDNHDED
jgi:DnaJ-class molecular chaperone